MLVCHSSPASVVSSLPNPPARSAAVTVHAGTKVLYRLKNDRCPDSP